MKNIKVSFNDYTYIGPQKNYGNNDKTPVFNGNGPIANGNYAFDGKHFNELINAHRYEDAADYAEQYRFNDPKKNEAFQNDIINLRNHGRTLSMVYKNVDNQEDLDAILFHDGVFVDGGLDSLDMNNSYYKQFMEYKKKLGSSDKKEATSLEVVFKPEKRALFNANWLDWVLKDNHLNIDNFYKVTGLNEEQLKSNGVEIIRNNSTGDTSLKFNKDNKYANQIIYQLNNFTKRFLNERNIDRGYFGNRRFFGYNSVDIKGYDSDGNYIEQIGKGIKNAAIKQTIKTTVNSIFPSTANSIFNEALGLNDFYKDNDNKNIREIGDLIDRAEKTKNRTYERSDTGNDYISSTVSAPIFDVLTDLDYQHEIGQIKDAAYNAAYKRIMSDISGVISSMGTANTEMFSNYTNEDPNVENLNLIESSNDRNKLLTYVGSVMSGDPKRVTFNSMISGGRVGTLITVNADYNAKKEGEQGVTDAINSRKIQIFVPGLFHELAQQKLNNDTGARAKDEYRTMLKYAGSKKLVDGRTLNIDANGRASIDGQELYNENEVLFEITKDIIKKEGKKELIASHINADGNIIDYDNYDNYAKALALQAVNEYNGTPLTKDDGTSMTIKDVFSFFSDLNNVDMSNIKSQYQADVYYKILDIYDIYKYLVNLNN